MRRFSKSPEPQPLLAWKIGTPSWRTNPPAWANFPDPPSGDVKMQATADQGQLCCYCTASIKDGCSHIEHFRPQGDPRFTSQRYDWVNLLASCESYQKGKVRGVVVATQRHCGHAKGGWFEPWLVDPLASVNGLFRFPLDGRICPGKSLSAARYREVEQTIEKLNLHCPSLKARRQAVLADAATDAAAMTEADWKANWLLPGAGGALPEFLPALLYNYDLHWKAAFV